MKVFDILKNRDEIQKQLISKSLELQKLEGELQSCTNNSHELQSQMEKEVNLQKESMRNAFIENKLKPFEDQLSEAKDERESLIQEYDKVIASITVDTVSTEYSSEQEIIDELNELGDIIENLMRESIGTSTYDAIVNSLESTSVKMEREQIDVVLDYYNKNEKVIGILAKIKNPVTSIINMLEDNLMSVDIDITFKYIIPVFGLVYLIISCIFAKFVFPFVILIIFLSVVLNFVTSYILYKTLVLKNIIEYNVKEITSGLQQEIIADVEQKHAELEAQKEQDVNEIDETIRQLTNQIEEVAVSADSEFEFNENDVKVNFIKRMDEMKNRADMLNSNISSTKKDIEQLKSKKDEIQNELLSSVENLANELAVVSDSKSFNPIFVFNIDKKTFNITTFTHPNTSVLFIATKNDILFSLAKLLNVQLRGKLNPLLFNVVLVDIAYAGVQFINFSSQKKDATESNLFKIISDENTLNEVLNEEVDKITSRISSIRRSAANISEYNELMLSMNSVPISYEFWFLINPPDSILGNEIFQRMINTGSEIGIMMNIFTTIDSMKDKKNSYQNLLKIIPNCFNVGEDKIQPVTPEIVNRVLERKTA